MSALLYTPGRLRAKVCGLTTPAAVDAAVEGGAGLIGFVFFAASPRDIAPDAAARLAAPARARGVGVVAVTVDADDALLDQIRASLAPDFVQLHGNETPARAVEAARRTGAGAVKAIPVLAPNDPDAARAYAGAVDGVMFDAKPPAGAALPGGNGHAFDWAMLRGVDARGPWFLAGGLNPWNVKDAAAASGARWVDVSSGVERAPGVKDPALISAFLDAVKKA